MYLNFNFKDMEVSAILNTFETPKRRRREEEETLNYAKHVCVNASLSFCESFDGPRTGSAAGSARAGHPVIDFGSSVEVETTEAFDADDAPRAGPEPAPPAAHPPPPRMVSRRAV